MAKQITGQFNDLFILLPLEKTSLPYNQLRKKENQNNHQTDTRSKTTTIATTNRVQHMQQQQIRINLKAQIKLTLNKENAELRVIGHIKKTKTSNVYISVFQIQDCFM